MNKDRPAKIVAPRLPQEVVRALVNIVGKEWVSEDRAIVETYSRFSVDITGTLKKHNYDDNAENENYNLVVERENDGVR
jgi:hypothetical protein